MKKQPKIRLYINTLLQKGEEIVLEDAQSHYLINVLRQEVGANILCFDGKTGEYVCAISQIKGKKQCLLQVLEKTQDFSPSPDIWLLFAPVKKDKTDFIIEKATELGVSKLLPTITQRTISEKIKLERYQAQAVEAAEQSRRLDIPEILDSQSLSQILQKWDSSRVLCFMDESGQGQEIATVFNASQGKAAILVGPEGGFSEDEAALLRKQPFVKSVSMGTRILRAETAVVAALSVWQSICGDWKGK